MPWRIGGRPLRSPRRRAVDSAAAIRSAPTSLRSVESRFDPASVGLDVQPDDRADLRKERR
jgi:hypothetical protein